MRPTGTNVEVKACKRLGSQRDCVGSNARRDQFIKSKWQHRRWDFELRPKSCLMYEQINTKLISKYRVEEIKNIN